MSLTSWSLFRSKVLGQKTTGLVPASVHSSTAMRFASYYHLTAVNGIRGWEREQNLSILQMSLSHHCLRWWSTSSFVPRFLPPKVFWSSEVLKWWLQTVLSNFHLQWPVSLSINQSITKGRKFDSICCLWTKFWIFYFYYYSEFLSAIR